MIRTRASGPITYVITSSVNQISTYRKMQPWARESVRSSFYCSCWGLQRQAPDMLFHFADDIGYGFAGLVGKDFHVVPSRYILFLLNILGPHHSTRKTPELEAGSADSEFSASAPVLVLANSVIPCLCLANNHPRSRSFAESQETRSPVHRLGHGYNHGRAQVGTHERT